MYVYGSPCAFMDGWPMKGSYPQYLSPASECLQGLFCLSILGRKPQKEVYLREPARPEEKTNDVCKL